MSCMIVGYPLAFSLTMAVDGKLIGLWGAMSTAWFVASTIYVIVTIRMDWQGEADTARLRSRLDVKTTGLQETSL